MAVLEVIDNMDVNLTGQVAANLVQNPIMIMSAGAIGGLVTGGLTLLGIWITQKHEARRDKENRNEEKRRIRREERKRAYIKFFTLMSTLINANTKEDITVTPESFKEFSQCISEIELLSPEIGFRIKQIYLNQPDLISKDDWKKFSRELRSDVMPLMQDELNTWSDEDLPF